MHVAAADSKQVKPAPAAASTTHVKPESERCVEEMIQPKKAAAPTKAGKCRLMSSVQVISVRVLDMYRVWLKYNPTRKCDFSEVPRYFSK